MKHTLALAHRVCPVMAKTASPHFTDKFEMVKATTASLRDAIAGIDTKLTVILDGCGAEYEKLFDDTFAHMEDCEYSRISTPRIGNAATYSKQIDVLSQDAACAQFLYLSEDDYIYRKDAFHAMMDFLTHDGVDFVTPLDHPDRYSHLVPEARKTEVRVSDFCHWQEVGTTCCTFMTKSATFLEARHRLDAYSRGSGDGPMWLGITKESIFSPAATIGAAFNYVLGRRKTEGGLEFTTLAAWKYHKLSLAFGRKYRLWGPMPSLCVHLCTPSLPPFCGSIMKR